MRFAVAAICVALLVGCTKEVGNTSASPTPTPNALSLIFDGPYSILATECTQFDVKIVDKAGSEQAAPSAVTVSLSADMGAPFYSDSACTTATTTADIAAGTVSTTVWVLTDAPGTLDISASDDASALDPASLTLSVDALLLGAQAFSSYEGTFNNSAWTTVEESAGVPMQVSVTVPPTGRWYIEVRARSSARENNAQVAARLRQDDGNGPVTVDYDVLNGNDGEAQSTSLVYLENDPIPGATYSYTVQWTGSSGATQFYNFQQYTIGPASEQVLGPSSQITAVVRPARYSVE